MDAVKFLKERKRMCDSYPIICGKCKISEAKDGLHCYEFQYTLPERAVAIVEKLSEEHPRKTFLQDFLEKYPKAELIHNKFPEICPYSLGYAENRQCFLYDEERFCSEECEECWNRPMEEE